MADPAMAAARAVDQLTEVALPGLTMTDVDRIEADLLAELLGCCVCGEVIRDDDGEDDLYIDENRATLPRGLLPAVILVLILAIGVALGILLERKRASRRPHAPHEALAEVYKPGAILAELRGPLTGRRDEERDDVRAHHFDMGKDHR